MTFKAVHALAETPAHADQPTQEFRYGWIGPEDAMRHIGISGNGNLYRLIKEEGLPYGRCGRLYRFRRVDLDAWLVQHTVVGVRLTRKAHGR